MKKMLMMALAVILIVVISVSATFAYLTDTDEVINTFTVGTVAIELKEYIGDDTPVETANINDIVPGHTYAKKPVVTVKADSEDCWVFVKVENGLAGVETKTAAKTLNGQITSEAKGWTALDGVAGVYYREVKKDADKDQYFTVFEEFTVNGEMINTQMNAVNGKQITVTAYAVQADGFNTAKAAWDATFGKPANP